MDKKRVNEFGMSFEEEETAGGKPALKQETKKDK